MLSCFPSFLVRRCVLLRLVFNNAFDFQEIPMMKILTASVMTLGLFLVGSGDLTAQKKTDDCCAAKLACCTKPSAC